MALTQPASAVAAPAPAERAKRVRAARERGGEQPAHSAGRSSGVDEQTTTAGAHIRRCTYRRVSALSRGRRQLTMYEVDCLHPTYDEAVRLGGLDAARAACAACTLPGVFRPDDD